MTILHFFQQTVRDAFGIARSPREAFKVLYGISLYRNSFYLILNAVLLSATGFLFWMVAAKYYATEAIGLAAAAVVAMQLLAVLSTLGIDFSLIRFLPHAGEKSRDLINTCFTINGAVSIAAALIFLAGLSFWAPDLSTIRTHPVFAVVFIISVTATTLGISLERVFIAKRRAGFAFGRGLIFGLLRFIPLIILAAHFGTFGIFVSWGLCVSLAGIIGIVFWIPRIENGYYPFPVLRKTLLKEMLHFSSSNYFTNLAWMLPHLVLPIMVLNILDAEETAYFYIAWSIGRILFMIPEAISFSLFAEGARNEERLAGDIIKSFKLILFLMVPAVLLVLLLGDKVLQFFGEEYSENAFHLLLILALSAIPVGINQIYLGMKRAQMQMRIISGLSVLIAFGTLGFSCVLLPKIGIEGAGVAWLASQTLVTAFVILSLLRERAKIGFCHS